MQYYESLVENNSRFTWALHVIPANKDISFNGPVELELVEPDMGLCRINILGDHGTPGIFIGCQDISAIFIRNAGLRHAPETEPDETKPSVIFVDGPISKAGKRKTV